MSYDIDLVHPVTKQTLLLDEPHFMRGGAYCPSGTRECSLNITYNYGNIFRSVMGEAGIRSIYGMTGAESVPVLQDAISKLDDDVSDDYWEATQGNAKSALCGLLALARMRPDGVWDGD